MYEVYTLIPKGNYLETNNTTSNNYLTHLHPNPKLLRNSTTYKKFDITTNKPP